MLFPFDQHEKDRLEEFFHQHAIESVKIVWCDLHGLARGKVVSRRKFYDELHQGVAFSIAPLFMDLQGEVVDPSNRISETGWTSCYACPDLGTLRLSPTEPHTAEVIAQLNRDREEPVSFLPRQVLRRVLHRAQSMGYRFLVGSELEFYLLDGEASTTLPPGKNCYRLLQGRQEKLFLSRVLEAVHRTGLNLEASMSEDGPGQFEIVLYQTPALEHADHVFWTRGLIKSLAADQGLTATFLSKPLSQESGSGYHLHQTLASLESDHSLFDERAHGEQATQILQQFTAGQLHHLAEVSAFLLPTVNAYKRILARGARPLTLTWGEDNRTVALRIVGRGTPDARIENRVAGGECNPYLAIAASISAGLHGIEERESLPPPTHGNAFESATAGRPFPRDLGAALEALEASRLAEDWLGEELIEHFVSLKRHEWERYLRAITDWEKQEYLAFL